MKTGLILIGLALACIPWVEARERGNTAVTSIFRNDGNSNNPFAVTCSSFAWTSVGSTSDIATTITSPTKKRRRAMTVQTLSDVTYAVCLSSTNITGNTCSDIRPGYELGSAWGSVSIYDEAVWYCRTRTGGSTYIKGTEHFDNRDELK